MHKIRKIQRQAWIELIGGALAILACGGGCSLSEMKSYLCRGEVRTKVEIIELADAKLTRFCLQQGIDKKEFSDPPKLTLEEKEKLWIIDYQSSEHFVRFIVDNCGAIETSFGPSEKVTKVE